MTAASVITVELWHMVIRTDMDEKQVDNGGFYKV